MGEFILGSFGLLMAILISGACVILGITLIGIILVCIKDLIKAFKED